MTGTDSFRGDGADEQRVVRLRERIAADDYEIPAIHIADAIIAFHRMVPAAGDDAAAGEGDVTVSSHAHGRGRGIFAAVAYTGDERCFRS